MSSLFYILARFEEVDPTKLKIVKLIVIQSTSNFQRLLINNLSLNFRWLEVKIFCSVWQFEKWLWSKKYALWRHSLLNDMTIAFKPLTLQYLLEYRPQIFNVHKQNKKNIKYNLTKNVSKTAIAINPKNATTFLMTLCIEGQRRSSATMSGQGCVHPNSFLCSLFW